MYSFFHTWRTDHKCDSDRQVTWMNTQCTVNAEKQMTLFKWISKNYHGEVTKFAELSLFAVLPSSQKWQNSGKMLIGLES